MLFSTHIPHTMISTTNDPTRLLMQTPHEALAEARAEIVSLLEENRLLRDEIRKLKEKEDK